MKTGKEYTPRSLKEVAANKFSNIIIGRNRHGKAIYNGASMMFMSTTVQLTMPRLPVFLMVVSKILTGMVLRTITKLGKEDTKPLQRKMSWKMQLWMLKKEAGILATINVRREWHCNKSGWNVPYGYYLGGTDEKTEGVWEWITKKLGHLPSGQKVNPIMYSKQ